MRMPKWVEDFYIKWGIYPIAGGCGNDNEDTPPPPPAIPAPPARLSPEDIFGSSSRLSELDKMYRQYIGMNLPSPGEWDTQANIYNQLLGYTPAQFQYPLADIQKALEAQQALQLEQYQKQIRPVLAQQGQLDSTYYANLLGDYLKGQQSQSLESLANLLTNQAQQNYQLNTWLPQFRANIAGQLGGIGSQKLGLSQYNAMLPLQTYIPGLENLYGAASNQAGTQYSDTMDRYNIDYQNAMNRYNYDTQNWQNQQKQKAGFAGAMGTLGGAGLGAGLGALFAAPTGGMSLLAGLGYGALGGATAGSMLSPLWGGSGTQIDLSSLLGSQMDSSRYNVNWNKPIQGGRGGRMNYSQQFGNSWSPYS